MKKENSKHQKPNLKQILQFEIWDFLFSENLQMQLVKTLL